MIAIYARQSVEKKDSISIESQIEYAKREIFTEDFKIYQDSGYSGKNTNRPAFHEMMADVQRQSIQDGSVSSGGVNFDNAKLSSIPKKTAYVRADTAIYSFTKPRWQFRQIHPK